LIIKKRFLIGIFILVLINTLVFVPSVKGNWEYSVKTGDFLKYNCVFQNKTIISFYRVSYTATGMITQTLINTTTYQVSYSLKINVLILKVNQETLFGNVSVYNGSNLISHMSNITIGKKIPDKINSTEYTTIYSMLMSIIYPKYVTLYILDYSWASINNFYSYFGSSFAVDILDFLQRSYNLNGKENYLINTYRMRFSEISIMGLRNDRQFGNPINFDDFYWNCMTGILMERYYYNSDRDSQDYGSDYNHTANYTTKVIENENVIQMILTNTSLYIPQAFPIFYFVIIFSGGISILIVYTTYKKLYRPKPGKIKKIEEYLSSKSMKFKKKG